MTSFMGKGSIPEDHPLSVGALWEPGNVVDDLVRDADCMIVFGSKLGVQATSDFQLRFPPELIRIDVDAHELSLNAAPTLPILGDAGLAAEGIASLLGAGSDAWRWLDARSASDARKRAEETAWHAERRNYVDALRSAIPRDGIFVNDMTQMSYVGCYLYPVYEPRTFMFPSGYGTLGFSMPAAIGAKIAMPDHAVVPIVGDGGYQFTMSELGTAIQERLGLPIVIFNDSTYSAVKEAQANSRRIPLHRRRSRQSRLCRSGEGLSNPWSAHRVTRGARARDRRGPPARHSDNYRRPNRTLGLNNESRYTL